MSAGCAKADRQRKSKGNVKYIAGKRDLVNSERKQMRNMKEKAKKDKHPPLKGVARAKKRWLTGVTKPTSLPSVLKGMKLKHASVKAPKLVVVRKEQPTIMINGMSYPLPTALALIRQMSEQRKKERAALLLAA